ncbi:MAG: hypothetical protein DRR00_23520, partial [Candidatus Parabeggiatoa sp. nov. 3]
TFFQHREHRGPQRATENKSFTQKLGHIVGNQMRLLFFQHREHRGPQRATENKSFTQKLGHKFEQNG